jgi:hypothetical protein
MKVAESNLVSKVKSHHAVLGDDHVETLSLGLMIEGEAEKAHQPATFLWENPEIRSDAQLADATLKLKDVLPWRMQMEYLGYSDQEIRRAETLRATDTFSLLGEAEAAAAAGQPVPPVAVRA